jgi:hypothetical protein
VCAPGRVLAREIVGLADLGAAAARLIALHAVDAVIVGDQTNSKRAFAILRPLAARVSLVRERDSTMKARRRYFRDHPPRGWRRFWPVGLQVPPEPYDDYAAVVLGEEFLAAGAPAAFREAPGKVPAGPQEL